jgi:hypothetical protein
MFHVRHFSSFSDGVMVNAAGETMTVHATPRRREANSGHDSAVRQRADVSSGSD